MKFAVEKSPQEQNLKLPAKKKDFVNRKNILRILGNYCDLK